MRCLKSPFSREFFKREYDATVSNEELEAMGAGALRLAVQEGDEKKGCFMAGQVAGMVHKEQPVREIIEEMFAQAETILRGAGKWVR